MCGFVGAQRRPTTVFREPCEWKEAPLGAKNKVLSEWDKRDYRKKIEILRLATDTPRYACEECGRVANEDRWLCDPIPLDKRS